MKDLEHAGTVLITNPKGNGIMGDDRNGTISWENLAAKLFCLICAGAAIYFAGKYVVGFAMPFLFAWVVSASALRASVPISRKLKIPERLCAAATVLFLLALIFILSALAVNRIIVELGRLISELGNEHSDDLQNMISTALAYFDSLGSRVPLIHRLREMEELSAFFDGLDGVLGSAFGSLISGITAGIPSLAASLIKSLPSLLISFAVAVISSFYFALDRERVGKFFSSLVPQIWRHHLPELRRSAGRAAAGYIKAYLIILLITFCELFIGFSVLRVDYAFLLAAVIAVIDILPVLGVGTVLIPWATIAFIEKNMRLGFGLLILYGVIVIVRQFAEPKIVGGTLGIHPLLTLAAMYLGFRLFGVAGMIIGPILALLARAIATACRGAPEGSR